MQPIAAVERFLERLLERPTARLFRSPLQPIQIQRRIERAMENERRAVGGRARVPDRYRVHLAPADVEALGDRAGQLAADLADEALAFARAHGYALDQAPTVELIVDRTVPAGEARVTAGRNEPRPDRGSLESGPDPGEGDLNGTRAFEAQPPAATSPARIEDRSSPARTQARATSMAHAPSRPSRCRRRRPPWSSSDPTATVAGWSSRAAR